MDYQDLRSAIRSTFEPRPDIGPVSTGLTGSGIGGSIQLESGELLQFSVLPVEGDAYYEVTLVRSEATAAVETVVGELLRIVREHLAEDEGIQTRNSEGLDVTIITATMTDGGKPARNHDWALGGG